MHWRRFRFLYVTGLAALHWLIASASGSAQNVRTESAEELTVIVTERLSSIDTLLCDFTVTQNVDEPGKTRTKACRFARDGGKWHFTEQSRDEARGEDREATTCCDGEKVYSLVVPTAGDGTKHWNPVEVQDPRDQGNIDPDYLLGAKISNISRSLADLFATNAPQLVRTADGGAPVLRLAGISASRQDSGNVRYDLSVTLDEAHDFLPREILVTESKDTVTWPGWSHRWRILDYRLVFDQALGKERWFPARGRFEQGKRQPPYELAVTTVTINSPLDATLFRPDIPDGTAIADATASGGGKRTVKGGSRRIDRTAADPIAKATDSSRPWRLWLFAVNGAIMVSCALAIWWRRIRRNRDSISKKGSE